MIRPTGNWVLIKELPQVRKTGGGILLPDIADMPSFKMVQFEVLGVGPKADQEIKPGNTVLIDQFRSFSKQDVGEGQWLVQDSALALVIPR